MRNLNDLWRVTFFIDYRNMGVILFISECSAIVMKGDEEQVMEGVISSNKEVMMEWWLERRG